MKITERLHGFLWQSMTVNNCNTYLIDGPTRILIDPGHEMHFGHVKTALADLEIGLADIGLVICTHGHPDHLEAVRLFQELPAKIAYHQKEWEFVRTVAPSRYGLDPDDFEPDLFLDEGDLRIDGIDLTVYHTPGHSPGGICLHWAEPGVLFSGDLIFERALGRTDLPGGSGQQLKDSIRRVAAVESRWLLSGHGDIVAGSDHVQANFQNVIQEWFNYV